MYVANTNSKYSKYLTGRQIALKKGVHNDSNGLNVLL